MKNDLGVISSQLPLLVINGQQRLATSMLLLEVLSRHLDNNEPSEDFSAKKIRNHFLLNSLEEGESDYKLLLTPANKDSLLALVTQKSLPRNVSLRIKKILIFLTTK